MVAVFLDLKKTFDTVHHDILLNKLKAYNFSDETIAWFRSYLENREQWVRCNSTLSIVQTCRMGIPQGSILGPILFSLYINDLPDSCERAKCQMYADDTIIYVSAKTPEMAAEILSEEMSGVSQWLQNNHLTLNYKKTVSVCFSIKKKANANYGVKINEIEIDQVDEFKFLGVILDSQLKFDRHVKKLCKTVKINLNCFRLIRQYIPLKAAQQYMHAMIFSHLSYCITVWGQANQTTLVPIRSLYKQALKIMDQKPIRWHHCRIIQKFNLLSFDSFADFCFLKLSLSA